MTEPRIRWEAGQWDNLVGYVGTLEPWAFQIWHIADAGHWSLVTSLPEHQTPVSTSADPEKLKGRAEDWLAGFVSSLGAVFPEVPGTMFADVTDEETLRARLAPGCYVRYAHPDAGYPGEQDEARSLLVLGRVYGIARSDIGQSRTDLGLVGIEGRFNSVLFEPVPVEGQP